MKHLIGVRYKTINHNDQRYNTAGDYYKSKEGLEIRVSKLQGWREEGLVLVHELVEWLLVTNRGIPIKDIDNFDKNEVEEKYEDDPGLSPKAPYHKEHLLAVKIEKMIAKEMNMDYEVYDKYFDTLVYRNNKK